MAYTTNQLISGSYYAAGVVSREFETVSGGQITDGLGWLNDILSEKRVDNDMTPYEDTYNFISQPGVEKYFIPDLISIDTLVFYLDKVRYSMTYTKRNQYFGSSRVENINTLPYEWYFERQTGGGNLYIYFKPDRNYPVEIHGSFNLATVQLNQNLLNNITFADLGVPKIFGKLNFNIGSFELTQGQFVVNNVDLMGSYDGLGSLVNYINSGIIPGVQARIDVNNFVLESTNQPPSPIYVQSVGYPLGTTDLGNVAAATDGTNLTALYNPGFQGIGATLTNSGVQAPLQIDFYNVALNDRVLIKDQTNPIENGLYIVTVVGTGATNWVLTRATNYDTAIKISQGGLFTALNGVGNQYYTFIQKSLVQLVGFSPILFEEFTALTFANFSTIETPLYQIFNARGYDQFFLTYLRYALADRICAEYNYDTPPNVLRQLGKYEGWISQKSKLIDLRMEKTSTLQKKGTVNWAWVNLGKGWTPS